MHSFLHVRKINKSQFLSPTMVGEELVNVSIDFMNEFGQIASWLQAIGLILILGD